MQLVICDDDPKDLKELERLLLKYKSFRSDARFKIEKYSDTSALLNKIEKKETADLYILDIIMSQMTGIDLGNEIRKINNKSILIYVTASDGFALDAYNVHAIRYLLKPIEENKLFEALDYALLHINDDKNSVYLVKTKEGLKSILYSEIEYIENVSRKLEIHLTNREKITSIYIRKSFEEETKELINAQNFICVHKSFLINMNHVRTLRQSTVIMESGVSIPVSRTSALDVKKKYLLFISAQYK